MAIAPIDLQTIFTQVDKVGKVQAEQREGQAIQQAMHGVQIQRKTDEQIRQVNETQDTGEGVEKIKDRASRQDSEKKDKENQNSNSEENEEEQPKNIFRDPGLGKKIDISY